MASHDQQVVHQRMNKAYMRRLVIFTQPFRQAQDFDLRRVVFWYLRAIFSKSLWRLWKYHRTPWHRLSGLSSVHFRLHGCIWILGAVCLVIQFVGCIGLFLGLGDWPRLNRCSCLFTLFVGGFQVHCCQHRLWVSIALPGFLANSFVGDFNRLCKARILRNRQFLNGFGCLSTGFPNLVAHDPIEHVRKVGDLLTELVGLAYQAQELTNITAARTSLLRFDFPIFDRCAVICNSLCDQRIGLSNPLRHEHVIHNSFTIDDQIFTLGKSTNLVLAMITFLILLIVIIVGRHLVAVVHLC